MSHTFFIELSHSRPSFHSCLSYNYKPKNYSLFVDYQITFWNILIG